MKRALDATRMKCIVFIVKCLGNWYLLDFVTSFKLLSWKWFLLLSKSWLNDSILNGVRNINTNWLLVIHSSPSELLPTKLTEKMVEIIILLIASLVVLSTAIPSIDYCSSVYCPSAAHTACNNTGVGLVVVLLASVKLSFHFTCLEIFDDVCCWHQS